MGDSKSWDGKLILPAIYLWKKTGKQQKQFVPNGQTIINFVFELQVEAVDTRDIH